MKKFWISLVVVIGFTYSSYSQANVVNPNQDIIINMVESLDHIEVRAESSSQVVLMSETVTGIDFRSQLGLGIFRLDAVMVDGTREIYTMEIKEEN